MSWFRYPSSNNYVEDTPIVLKEDHACARWAKTVKNLVCWWNEKKTRSLLSFFCGTAKVTQSPAAAIDWQGLIRPRWCSAVKDRDVRRRRKYPAEWVIARIAGTQACFACTAGFAAGATSRLPPRTSRRTMASTLTENQTTGASCPDYTRLEQELFDIPQLSSLGTKLAFLRQFFLLSALVPL